MIKEMQFNMKSTIKRETKETRIKVSLDASGSGLTEVDTGIELLDEILAAIANASGFDLVMLAKGDLETGDHHTVEDVGIALGAALGKLFQTGIGSSMVPSGECLAVAAVRFGVPGYFGDFEFEGFEMGGMALENFGHFARSIAYNGRFNLHLIAKGGNDHQKIEGMMIAFGRALRQAAIDGGANLSKIHS
jgi:imidazoleglycerol phosphate dehydratase HisB